MLKKNDVVIFMTNMGDCRLGVVKGDLDKKFVQSTYTIYPICKFYEYEIEPESLQVFSNKIQLKFNSVKKIKIDHKQFNQQATFKFDPLSDNDVELLLTWHLLDHEQQNQLLGRNIGSIKGGDQGQNQEEQDESLLTKRTTRRATKQLKCDSIGQYVEVLDFSKFVKSEEFWQRIIKEERNRQKDILPSFIRTATTNLRFEIPSMAKNIDQDSVEINFLDPRLKQEKQSILKSLSQDLNLTFNPDSIKEHSSKQIKFTEVVKQVVYLTIELYGEKISIKSDSKNWLDNFGSVPTSQQIEQTLHHFKNVQNYLEQLLTSQGPDYSSTTKLESFSQNDMYYLIISNLFIFSLRFFLSLKANKLHLLKNKFYLDNYDSSDSTTIDRLNKLIKSMKKFVTTIRGLMTEQNNNDYLDLLKSIGCLIGHHSEAFSTTMLPIARKESKLKSILQI